MTAQFDYQGFGILSQWSGALSSSAATAAFADIAATGSNSVALDPELLVQNSTSSTLVTSATKSTSDASLISGIKAAQATGLTVLLEPIVTGLDGTLSYALQPADTNTFFASYKAAIIHLATIAQQTGVDTLSLGTEMGTLTGSKYRAQWLDIIAAVRQVYAGKLTYKAAANEAGSVSFWDKLDLIGVNAYMPLSASSDPSVADMVKAWTTPSADPYWAKALNGESILDFMHSLSTTYGKQVLITEIGYRSITGTAINPGDWQTAGTANDTAQAKAYLAMMQAIYSQGGSWLAGLTLWDYELNTSSAATNYTPFGKAAQAIVQQYFTGTGSVSGSTITGSALGDLVDVGAGNDTVSTGLGNDVIRVGSGNDTIVAGPSTIEPLKTTTVVLTGYGKIGTDGNGGSVALLVNGQQVGATLTFTPASDSSGYQTYSITFTNPNHIASLDIALLSQATGAWVRLSSITINGASVSGSDVTNGSSSGTLALYANSIHLDATNYQDWFYAAQTDNDLIYAGSGTDTIDGGAGIDTVVFTGTMAQYTFARSGSSLIVTDTAAGRNGKDTLTNVEYLQFSDQRVAVGSLVVADSGSTTATGLLAPLMSSATVGAATTTSVAAAAASTTMSSATTPAQIAVSGVSVAGATVTLLNGSTVLGTTTASSTGAYSFTLTSVADGVYALTTTAKLGSLASSASSATTLVVGSAADVAGLIAAAATAPQAIYITDPADPIVVSVSQLSAITARLRAVVTSYSLAVSDTALNVLAAIDNLAAQTNLATITLTDTNVLAVSLTTMNTLLANDKAILAKIAGGYSFSVTTTSTSSTTTTLYDSTGTVTSTTNVIPQGTKTQTFTRYADGTILDVYTDASGNKLSESRTTASGRVMTIHGVTGQPFTSAVYTYDTTGKQTSLTKLYANGSVYSTQAIAADGSTTTVSYDTAGRKTQQVATTAGTTDTVTYDTTGATVTDLLVTASGKTLTQFGLTGAFAKAVFTWDATGKLTSLVKSYASGIVYSSQVTASDGGTTTISYDTAGNKTQQVTVTAAGTTDTVTYDAAGAKLTDLLFTANGRTLTQYGLTGAFDRAVFTWDASGKPTGLTKLYAAGGVYSAQTIALDGTSTTTSYDTAGHKTQVRIAYASGALDITTYDAGGAKLTDSLTNAAGSHYTTYGITGKSYTSETVDSDSSGKLLDVVQTNTDGSVTTNVAASGITLSFSNAVDKIISPGGDTFVFPTTPFQDTIQSFHGGDATGHDTIVLSKSLASSFATLSVAKNGWTTMVTIDNTHSLALTGLNGTLTASDFKFV